MENNGDVNIPKLEGLLTTEEIHKSNNISKITDKIYLGDIDGAREVNYLKQEKITHIISLAGKIFSPEYEEGLFKRKIIDIIDFEDENIFQYFKDCIQFIESAKKIYIHCMAGVSRSATIVIAYIMWKEHKNYNDAFNFVKNKRKLIMPNMGFTLQLKYFDNLLKLNNYNMDLIDFNKCDLKELWKTYGFK